MSTPAGSEGLSEERIAGGNEWFAFSRPGEVIDARVVKSVDFSGSTVPDWMIRVVGPGGAVVAGPCVVADSDPAGTACDVSVVSSGGVYSVQFGAVEGEQVFRDAFTWEIDVRSAGVAVPGRVWTDNFRSVTFGRSDLEYVALTHDGYRYRVGLSGFWGFWSDLFFSETGPVSESCLPEYRSTLRSLYFGLGAYDSCRNAKIFFDDPAPDLPGEVVLPDSSVTWLVSEPVSATNTGLRFDRSDAVSNAGTVGFSVTGYRGRADVRLDGNGDGDFVDPMDRLMDVPVVSDWTEFNFDGLNGVGDPIPFDQPFGFEVSVRPGELHFTLVDVEQFDGMWVEVENGPAPGPVRLYWDDTVGYSVPDPALGCVEPVRLSSGSAGVVASRPGVRGPWGNTEQFAVGACIGDMDVMDTWTFRDEVSSRIAVPARTASFTTASSVVSAGDAAGETVVLEWRFANTGDVALESPVLMNGLRVDGFVCPGTVVAPGTEMVCQSSHVITQAELDAGAGGVFDSLAFAGTAVLRAPGGVAVIGDAQQVSVMLDRRPQVVTSGGFTVSEFSSVGEELAPFVIVENTGNVSVQVSVDGLDCPTGWVGPGGSVRCVGSQVTTQADVDAFSADAVFDPIVVTASGVDVGAAAVTAHGAGVSDPGILLTLDQPRTRPLRAGQPFDGVARVSNNGNVTLRDVTVSADGVTIGACVSTGSDPGVVSPTDALVCPVSGVTSQAMIDAGFGSFPVRVSGTSPDGQRLSTERVLVLTPMVAPGVTATIENVGPVDAAGVVTVPVRVVNSGNQTLVGPLDAVSSAGQVVCDVPDGVMIAPGTAIDCALTVPVDQERFDEGTDLNGTVVVRARTLNAALVNAEVAWTLVLEPDPVMDTAATFVRVADVGDGRWRGAGETLWFETDALNSGNVSLEAFVWSGVDGFESAGCSVAGRAVPLADARILPTERLRCWWTRVASNDDVDAKLVELDGVAEATGSGALVDGEVYAFVELTPRAVTDGGAAFSRNPPAGPTATPVPDPGGAGSPDPEPVPAAPPASGSDAADQTRSASPAPTLTTAPPTGTPSARDPLSGNGAGRSIEWVTPTAPGAGPVDSDYFGFAAGVFAAGIGVTTARRRRDGSTVRARSKHNGSDPFFGLTFGASDPFWVTRPYPTWDAIVAIPSAIRKLFPGMPKAEADARWSALTSKEQGALLFRSKEQPLRPVLAVTPAQVRAAQAGLVDHLELRADLLPLRFEADLKRLRESMASAPYGERALAEETLWRERQRELEAIEVALTERGVVVEHRVLSVPADGGFAGRGLDLSETQLVSLMLSGSPAWPTAQARELAALVSREVVEFCRVPRFLAVRLVED